MIVGSKVECMSTRESKMVCNNVQEFNIYW